MLKDIPLTAITIGERFRKDLGDIEGLAKSIDAIGLLHPILVTTDYELIIGRRRLAAHAHLGRETISARVIDLDDPFTAEVDENEQRKAYAMSECVGIKQAREERDKREALERKSEGGKKAGRGRKIASVDSAEAIAQKAEARDITASRTGIGWQKLQKAEVVVEAAKQDPDLQELVEKMDKTGNVSAAYRAIPPYIFEERPDLAPKTKPKKPQTLSYDKLMQRLDDFMMEIVFSHVASLSEADQPRLRALLQSYVTMVDTIIEEAKHAAAD